MNKFYFEMTDTFGGESNYSWVKRFEVNAKSLHGALCKLSNETGFNFRFDGNRYNVKNAYICMFELDIESIEHYKFKTID